MTERNAFKFPKLLKKPNIPIHSEKPKHDDVLKVEYNNIRNKALTGKGGFGKILSANYFGNEVVLKELIKTNHEDIIKEARFLQKLNHRNIIDFIGMDLHSIHVRNISSSIHVLWFITVWHAETSEFT